MPSRFYFPASGAAPVTPPTPAAGWNTTTGFAAFALKTSKSNTSIADGTSRTKGSTTANTNRLDRQYLSEFQLAAQSIPNTGTFSMVMKAWESNNAADDWLQVIIRVVSEDGVTVRGTLYAGSTATAESATAGNEAQEFPGTTTAAKATRIKNAIALTNTVSAEDGDRILVEVGYRSNGTTSTHSGTLEYGDPTAGSDYALTAGTTSAGVPWIEFSQTFTEYTPPPSETAARYNGSGGHQSTLSLGTQSAYTVCCWGRIVTDTNSYSTFLALDTGAANSLHLQTTIDGTTINVWDDNGGGQKTSAPALTVGTWYFFAIAVSGTTGTLYYRALADSSLSTVSLTGMGTRNIGRIDIGTNFNAEHLNGNVAAVKLWTAQLNSTELLAESQQYDAVRTTNLSRAWRLDGDLTEQTGNGTSLTGGGTATWQSGPPNIPLTGGTTYQGAATLTATATLTADASPPIKVGAVSLSAAATLTAQPTPIAGAVSLTIGSSLTAQPTPIAGAVSLTSVAVLTSEGSVSQPGAVSLTVIGSLSAAAFLNAAGAVSLSVGKTLTVGALLPGGAVNLTAGSSLTLTGTLTVFGAVSLTASTVLSVAGVRTTAGAVSLGGAATLGLSGTLTAFGAVALAASGTLTATPAGAGAGAFLTASSVLAIAGLQTAFATVALSATGVLSASPFLIGFGSVTLTVVPVLTTAVTVRITNGTVGLSILASLTASAGGVAGSVSLPASFVLSVNGIREKIGAASLVSAQSLSLSGVLGAFGVAQLNVLPNLVVGAVVFKVGAATLSILGVLTADGVRIAVGAITLLATGSLLYITIFPTVEFSETVRWSSGGIGGEDEWSAEGIHRDARPVMPSSLSGWTTDGIHAESGRSWSWVPQ